MNAEENEAKGIHTVSTDEKTGIQALERICPNKPMEPGKVERMEYEYIRNGTTCLFGNLNVGNGEIVSPLLNPTRTEEDFTNNIKRIIATDPKAGWIFVADNLNTHVSESLVLFVAKKLGIGRKSLGRKGKDGILKSMTSRKTFLEDESHRIRFVFTPKHCSWLNQIEIWFGILCRRLLNRSSFRSLEEMQERILAFIRYFNETIAKPFRWTFTGTPLKK